MGHSKSIKEHFMGLGAAALEGGLPVAGSLIAGIFNYYATKSTNKQNLQLYKENRADTLAQNKITNKQNAAQLALATRAQLFGEQQATQARADALENQGYGRMQDSFQRGAELYAQSMNLSQAKAAPFQKYARTA